MSETSIPFFTQTVLLDNYIKSDNPTADPEVLQIILKILDEKPELRMYFFQNRPHPAWLKVLWDYQFLINPPEPVVNDGEQVSFPFWDAQQYLTSVAETAPEIAVKHLENLNGHNWYRGRAIWTLQNVPEEFVNEAIPTILQWLSSRDIRETIAEDVFGFMLHIAEKKFPAALELMRVLTTPIPNDRAKKIEKYFVSTEAVSILSDSRWSYRNEETFKLLNAIDPVKVMAILEIQLISALRIEGETEEKQESEHQNSTTWRSAIEDHHQNLNSYFKNTLLASLRDTIEFLVKNDKSAAERFLTTYANHKYKILQRLRLYILQKFPLEFREPVKEELLDDSNYDDILIHHEFFSLLKNGYPTMSQAQKQTIIEIILKGPEKEIITNFAEWMNSEATVEVQEEYVRGYTRRWTRDRLFMIKEHLTEKTLEFYHELIAQEGEPDHPDFTGWTSGAYMVGDSSPIDLDQLSAMAPEKLVEFLKVWQPEENQFGPDRISYRGLGEILTTAITSNPFKYENYFVEIGMLRSEFSYALFNRFARKSSSDKDNSDLEQKEWEKLWSLYLALSEAILEDENLSRNMERTSEINWPDVRHAIVNLIEAEYKKIKSGERRFENPIAFLTVRNILIKLTEDPDPESQSDHPPEGWLGYQDPLTVTLNHVRPDAFLALIDEYSRHQAHVNQDNGQYPETPGPGPNRLSPVVERVLTKKLNKQEDNSWSVHSVFGRTLVALYWMNKSWVEKHIDDIFVEGQDEESLKYFVAAWDAFVIFNHPHYADLFKLLYPKYLKAIDNHSKGYVLKTHLEPSKNLARHLLAEYLFGGYNIKSTEGQESLLALFFNKVPPKTRGNAVWLLWKQLNDNPNSAPKFWDRAKDFWRWRVEVAASTNHSNDFDDEMQWFPRLLEFVPEKETIITLWDLLEGTLPYLSRINHFGMIWEEIEDFLVKQIAEEPVRVIQFYRLMHENSRRPSWVKHEENGTTILEKGAENSESREETLSLIDLIGSSGDNRYRYIYDKYAR